MARSDAMAARPALWRVSQGATTIYLFGTIHALPRGVHWFDGPVASAFGASGELVTEVVDINPTEMRAVVTRHALLPEGQNLRALLPPASRHRFERLLRVHGYAPDAFDRFQPWYAAVALTTMPLASTGYDPALGADAQLSCRAGTLGHPHEALETADYQLGLFAALPRATQLHYLDAVMRDLPGIGVQLKAMLRAWKSGDAPGIARLMNADEDDPTLRATLLVARNRAWAGWIRHRLEQPGAVFVAVGAGHLAGRDSVQAHLRALGIVAERVQ